MREFILRNIGIFFAAWYFWLPITFWFGRIFCRYICPLGLMQALVRFIFRKRVRRVCANLPRGKWQRIVSYTFVLVYFLLPCGYLLNPWGIFGRGVLADFIPGVIVLVVVLVLAAIGSGRLWCNWVCPLGTIFDATAKLGWKHERIVGGCSKCRRCFKA